MRVKTNELKGAALDWAVAQVEGRHDVKAGAGQCYTLHPCERQGYEEYRPYQPSADWSQGGPLFEKYIDWHDELDGIRCRAWPHGKACEWAYGSTLLIAAMRAIVAAELGGEVEVPDELAEDDA